MDINLVLYHLVCLAIASVISQTDVCVNYKTLNSTILKTDYTTLSRGVLIPPNWYRYTGTISGVIATRCPNQTNACGAKNQIWIEGALPTFGSGIQQIPSCVRTDRNGVKNCCGLRNKLEIENCNGFFVYHLTPTGPDRNYCFNATSPDFSTVTMPQTTTLDTSQDTTSTRATPPLTTQTRHATAPDYSTVSMTQTTTLDTSQDTTALDLSTVTMPQTTTIDTSQDTTSTRTILPLTTTLDTSEDTTSTRTSLPLTTQTIISDNTTPVPSTITFQLTTSASNTLTDSSTPSSTMTSQQSTTLKITTETGPSKSTEQSAMSPQLLIAIVSVFGCVLVVIMAVIAAVVYINRNRGDRNVTYRAAAAADNRRTSDLWIENMRFNMQRPDNY